MDGLMDGLMDGWCGLAAGPGPRPFLARPA